MIEYSASSRMGPGRQVNEDTVLADPELGLYVVADGLGGQQAGEVASQMAIEVLAQFIRNSTDIDDTTWPFGIDPAMSVNGNRLVTAVKLANRRVWKEADQHAEYMGMGATIVAALTNDESVTICAAGDSRAYVIRDGTIEQLTEDDSFVRVAARQGLADEEKLREHPMRNMITKAIGAEEQIDPELLEHRVRDGDLFLLCSDGVHKVLDDQAMLEYVNDVADLAAAAEALLATGLDGGEDDASVVLFRYRDRGS